MANASSVVIPNHFQCSLTLELMAEPVKTDCKGSNTGNIFKRIYYALFSESSFNGHVFENLALASWRTTNTTCPICRQTINKVTYDQDMEKKIKEQFIKASEANKKYFEKVKKELEEEPSYLHVRDKRVLPPQSTLESIKKRFNSATTNPDQTFDEIFNVESVLTSCLRDDNLERAESIVDRGFAFDFFDSRKDFYLKKIIKAYINRPYSSSNLQNAIRIIYKINWYDSRFPSREKNELLKTILRLSLNFDNLQMAEYAADRLSNISIHLQENNFASIADAYINRSYLDSNLNEAKRIVSTKTRLSNSDYMLESIAIKYIENGKYKEAYQTVKSISTIFLKLIAYVTISIMIGHQIPNKVTNATKAFKNFVNRARAWLKTHLP
ncbi:MAG: hypothetical protein K1060chlam1_00844 [Candidatus Anoxychlamydiales bacterium]|nr:hypothetical protein [Candidatus Anoxychlamydiales bacterium]